MCFVFNQKYFPQAHVFNTLPQLLVLFWERGHAAFRSRQCLPGRGKRVKAKRVKPLKVNLSRYTWALVLCHTF